MTDDPEEFDEPLRRALDRMAPPAGDVEGSFGGVLAGAQRRRRQRLLLRSSAVLAVAATAAAVAIVVATRPSSHSTDVATHPVTATTLVVPTVPTTLPVPTTAPVPTTVAAASCQATSPSAGPRAALDSCTLFVVTPRSTPGPNYSTVVEFDRRTGRMTRQLNLPGVDAVGVARAGVWLWVAAGSSVERIEPITLSVQGVIPVGFPAETVVANTSGVWVGGPGHLAFVPAGGHAVSASQVVDGDASSLALSPAADRLYVAQGNATSPQTGLLVTERDPVTGRVLVSRSEQYSLGGGSVAATDAGVWVDFPSGTANTGVFLRASDLRQAGSIPALPEGSGRFSLVATDQVLWIRAVHTYCADPSSGTLRAPTAGFDAVPLTADGTQVFITQGAGIAAAKADPRCLA